MTLASLLWFALGLLGTGGISASDVSTQDSRLIRWSKAANSTAYIPTRALTYLLNHDVRIDPESPILEGVPRSFIDHILTRHHRSRGPGYLDLTEVGAYDLEHNVEAQQQASWPTPSPSVYPELSSMFADVSAKGMYDIVNYLSNNFSTRYYRSTNASAASFWIRDQFVKSAGASNVVLINNTFDQPNVIAQIPRKSGSTSDEIVIIGAHLDSTSRSPTTRAPGADDDASGISVLIQALQILSAHKWTGTRAVEFHAYAGEEGGLLGSSRVASQYKTAGKKVRAMLQFDMIAYQPTPSPVLTILTDLDAKLVDFSEKLIQAYIPEAALRKNACGYACSDHFSWSDRGYPSISIDESGPSDTLLNPWYHTVNDTIDKLDFEKASAFVKLALSFAVELSG